MNSDRIINGIIIFIAFFMLYAVTNRQSDNQNRKTIQEKLSWELSGVVIDKYEYRGCTVIINGATGKWSISPASSSLYDSVKIGDTIIQQKNSNQCTILRGRKIDCDCYYTGN